MTRPMAYTKAHQKISKKEMTSAKTALDFYTNERFRSAEYNSLT